MSTIEDRWLAQKRIEFAQRTAAMLEEAERIKRMGPIPRKRDTRTEIQADYDNAVDDQEWTIDNEIAPRNYGVKQEE